jgi:hypothetical protein
MSRSPDESNDARFRRAVRWTFPAVALATLVYALVQWRSGESSRDRWGAPALASAAAWLLVVGLLSRLLVWSARRVAPSLYCRLQQRVWAVRWKLLPMFASLTFSLAAAECGLRRWLPTPRFDWLHDGLVTGYDQNDWQTSFCEFDPELGWRGSPNRRGWFTRPTFRVWVEQNSAGFRDIEHDPSHPSAQSLVILGDSFAWGFGVEQNETVTSQLRSRLRDVETFNLGVCGYGTDQSLLNLDRWSDTHPVSRVCYLFFANDLADNRRSFQHGHSKPMFSFVGGELKLATVPTRDESNSARRAAHGDSDFPPSPLQMLPHPGLSIRRAADYYISPRSVLYRHIRQVGKTSTGDPSVVSFDALTQSLVLEMKRVCEKSHAEFTLALIPERTVMKHADPAAYFAPVREWCRDYGIDCLDLTGSLVLTPDPPYLEEGHWNPIGHRVAADAIAEHIRRPAASPSSSLSNQTTPHSQSRTVR